MLLGPSLWAQPRTVSGTVSSTEGEPLAGVTVLVDDTNVAVITDTNGRFSVPAPANGTLRFSMLGMDTQEVAIGNRSVINVTLASSARDIDDVIVVAFGTSTREAFTGSAGVINSSEIAKRTATNITNTLAGQVSGVQIRSSDGQPGTSSEIRIRGFTSINAGNDPLIILDGAPYTGNLSTLNPTDIENITVLKDASATALYGARAANGVVMVTTKRASRSEAVINFEAKLGVGTRATVDYDYITDPAAHYELFYKGYDNYLIATQPGLTPADRAAKVEEDVLGYLGYNVYDTKGGPLFVNGKINPAATLGNVVTSDGDLYYLTPDNWTKEAFRSSIRQEYNLNVNGGTDRASYYLSIGYLDDKGIVAASSFERFTARFKGDFQAKKWLKVGGNVSYAKSNISLASGYDDVTGLSSGNIFAFTARMAPIYPLYLRDGDTKQILKDERGFTRYDYGDNAGFMRPYLPNGNPVSSNQLDDDSSTSNMFNMTGFAEITFTEGLKLNLTGTTYLNETRENNFTNPFYGQYAASNGILRKIHRRYFSYNFTKTLTYAKTIDRHSFDVLIGHENYDYRTTYLSGTKNNMFGTDIMELASAVNTVNTSSYATNYNTEGYFARGQYNYDHKYFGSVSFRRDATSRFHPDHRWGNFWSVGAAWVATNEDFLKDVSWLDMLKLKASYGTTGNDRIGDFRYVDTYEIVSSNDQVAVILNQKGNPEITWEKNANLNAGVEFGLFDNRLSGDVEFYNRSTRDLLFARPLPPSSGFVSYYDNIGDMRNTGVEISLNGVAVRTRDLNLSLYANITTVSNKITKLPPERVTDTETGFASGNYWIGQGGPLYSWYMKEYAGVDPNTGQSLWYISDVDANHHSVGTKTKTADYSEATDLNVGSALPKAYGGFGLNFLFYGFDLSVNFDYSIGGLAYDAAYAAGMRSPDGNDGQVFHKDLLQAWTAADPSSSIPRFMFGDSNNSAMSTRFLTDASYINLQNINLGYTLPAKWTNKIRINSIRVFCSAENIAYWSKRKGLDTRQNWNGSAINYNYSPIRTISGGLQLTF